LRDDGEGNETEYTAEKEIKMGGGKLGSLKRTLMRNDSWVKDEWKMG
jgi:hypothetical protein